MKFLVKFLKLLWVAADWRIYDQRSVKGIGEGEVQVLLGVQVGELLVHKQLGLSLRMRVRVSLSTQPYLILLRL